MPQRVLVTGASGLLGTWLLHTAPPTVEVVAATHRTPVDAVATTTVDLRDRSDVRNALEATRPTVVIHAAYAKDHPSIVGATEHLVAAANEIGTGFVHISSDTVFAGDGRTREEADPTDPTSEYGRWKADAERPVLEAGGAVVRVSLLASLRPDDHGLRRIRSGASERVPSRWYRDEFRQPAWASEVATAVWRLGELVADERAGCWHLPGPERLSRFELAARLVARASLPASAIVADARPTDSDRPSDIVLGDTRARREIDWSPSQI